jgi:outer membrane lipoprotein SlyB
MKTSKLLTALFAALVLAGCSTNRGGTSDDYRYDRGSYSDWDRGGVAPVRDFTQPIPPR